LARIERTGIMKAREDGRHHGGLLLSFSVVFSIISIFIILNLGLMRLIDYSRDSTLS
jgi:hypothetical protein